MKERAPLPPALGERRAGSGFWSQYRVQALLTYRALAQGLLEEVRIADPSAEQVDDFQFLMPGRLDAYQIKWSSYPGAFTFKNLIQFTTQERSLVSQLAQGWRRLQENNPQRRVIVHLLTNNHPSRDDKVAKTTPPGLPGHFAAFLEAVWNPWSDGRGFQVADHWQEARHLLVQASGLDESEFEVFVRACRLDFSYRLPSFGDAGSAIEQRVAREQENDLAALQALFFELVAAPGLIVAISHRDLLRRLGWEQRFELHHRHEFPDPEIPYRPIEASVDSLEQALSRLAGGYILLLGSPGSGKSTLLTQVLRYRPERVVRYYAFVRDDFPANRFRGEALSFLHDLTLELERQGVGPRECLLSSDPEILARRLQTQLEELHQDWIRMGRKTFLLVDGLDHIAREQDPQRSLLRDLPERVPDGVYILLGSQTDRLLELPVDVRGQIQQPERQLRLQPLSREAVFGILSEANLSPALTALEEEEIFSLSAGHPLALSYIINRLRQSSGASVAEVLTGVQPFYERIDDQYLAHWQQVADDFELVHLLALLVRIRGAIDLNWVQRWAPPKALYRLRRELAHYFRQERGDRWFFFHNSFRIFLLQQTRDPALGSEEEIFRELAEAAAAQPTSSSRSWGEIDYRLKAGETNQALALATIERVREQFYHGRPWAFIREDLKSLLPLTIPSQDSATLARLLFCGIEIGERAFNTEEYADLPYLLVRLREWPAALAWLEQEPLREDQVFWARETAKLLKLVLDLATAGCREEGQRLFERAEPLALLAGPQKIQHAGDNDLQKLLTAWVEVAPRFRPISQILEKIANLRHEESLDERYEPADADRDLRNHLRFRLVRRLAQDDRWLELGDLLKMWDPTHEADWPYWFWGHLRSSETAFLKGELARARNFLAPLVRTSELSPEATAERIFLADAVWQMLGDRAAAASLVEDVEVQPLSERRSEPHISQEDVELRFRHYRLLCTFGHSKEPREVIPEPSRLDDHSLTVFERALYRIACFWAEAWRGRTLISEEFCRQAEGILRSISQRPTTPLHRWYDVEGHRAWLFRRLIQAARLVGDSANNLLFDTFATEWSRPDPQNIWSSELQREILLEFGREPRFREKATDWLARSEEKAVCMANVVDRLESLKGVVEAWLDLGDVPRARATLSTLLRCSLGVHQKDHQTRSWIEWLRRVNKVDPARADRRLAFLATALPDLRNKEVLWRTSPTLVDAAWDWQPLAAQRLFNWLLDKSLIEFSDGLVVLIKKGIYERPAAHISRLILEEVLLPVARRDSGDLLREVSRALFASDKKHANNIATGLLRAVLGSSLVSQRRQLLTILQEEIGEAGLLWTDIVAGLTDALSRVDTESPTPLRADATIIDESQSYGVKALNQQARRLLLQGNHQGAWLAARSALEEPTDYRRSIWWQDREGFVETLSILRDIDAPKSREVALQSFVDDLCHPETSHFMQLGREFHRVAIFLSDPVPDRAIWASIEPYIHALFPYASEMEPPQLNPNLLLARGSARALVRLVLGWIEHPVYEISWGAQRIMMRLLFDQSEHLAEELPVSLSLFCGKMPTSWGLLTCLEAASLKAPRVLKPFSGSLHEIATCTDFLARRTARHILERLGTSPLAPPLRELPEIYRLVLPEREETLYPKTIEPHENLPPTEVPAEIVKAFRPELDWIADKAGVGRENLYTRVTQLAQEDAGADVHARDEALGPNLKMIGLKMPFRRPRTRRVRWAVSLATAELLDAGRFPSELVPLLEILLKNADPMMLLFQPDLHPTCIPAIAERLQKREVTEPRIRNDWTSRGSLSVCAVQAELAPQKDWIVLAEETLLRWLDWEEAEETRMGVLLPVTLPPPRFEANRDPLSQACIDAGHLLAEDYENYEADPACPILLRHGDKYETPGRRFLALNPTVGHLLGWSLSSNGLFRWENASGELMVESLWWQDGWMGYKSLAPEDEVGEGWLVRASRTGWAKLRELYPVLIAHLLVRRSADQQPKRQVSDRRVVDIFKQELRIDAHLNP
ncbi:MAG: AAA family ATPase [Thermoanaerobaculia bacterium]